MALDIAENLKLTELKPDIESLLDATRKGQALLPVYEKSLVRRLQRLNV